LHHKQLGKIRRSNETNINNGTTTVRMQLHTKFL
jgi:hypothetical protein